MVAKKQANVSDRSASDVTVKEKRQRRSQEEMLAELEARAAKMRQQIEERKNKVDVPKVGRGFINTVRSLTDSQLSEVATILGVDFFGSDSREVIIADLMNAMIDEANTK